MRVEALGGHARVEVELLAIEAAGLVAQPIEQHPAVASPARLGERGQVVMNHISKGMFIPNNLERDSAVRLAGPDGQIGDSVTEVKPVETFEGEAVIEGVY